MKCTLELLTGKPTISLACYKGVKNAKELKESIASLDYAIIDATLLTSLEQVVFAATQARLLFYACEARTKTLYTELLYRLSPSTNVTSSKIIIYNFFHLYRSLNL